MTSTINIKKEIKRKEEEQKRKDLRTLLNKDKLDDFELDVLMNDINVYDE